MGERHDVLDHLLDLLLLLRRHLAFLFVWLADHFEKVFLNLFDVGFELFV
jgi:hypothetical protein